MPRVILDETLVCRPETGAARVAFLRDALRILGNSLQARGSRLVMRDAKVKAVLGASGTALETVKDAALFEAGESVSRGGQPHTAFFLCKRIWLDTPAEAPLPAPQHVSVPSKAHGVPIPNADVLKFHAPWTLSPAERAHLGSTACPNLVVYHAAQRAKALAIYQEAVPPQ